MNRDEVINIIEEEKLENYNLNEERQNNENEVGIKYENGCWNVYATDERASTVTGSEKEFHSEDKAFDDFIKRLRAQKVLRGYK